MACDIAVSRGNRHHTKPWREAAAGEGAGAARDVEGVTRGRARFGVATRTGRDARATSSGYVPQGRTPRAASSNPASVPPRICAFASSDTNVQCVRKASSDCLCVMKKLTTG